MKCKDCEYETNCVLPCIKNRDRFRNTTMREEKLLDAYRFVFSRHFLKDDDLVSALQIWQPDIYKLISSDIGSEL